MLVLTVASLSLYSLQCLCVCVTVLGACCHFDFSEEGPMGGLWFKIPLLVSVARCVSYMQHHMWPFCISATCLDFLFGETIKALLMKCSSFPGAETLETLDRRFSSRNTGAFYAPPEPCVKLPGPCYDSEPLSSKSGWRGKKMSVRVISTTGLASAIPLLPFPLKTTTWCSDKKGILMVLGWIIYNYDWINL